MLMNPQYPSACYADMYRGHIPPYHGVNPAAPAAVSAASLQSSHQQHVFHNNNMTPDFFNSGSLSSSCYTPTPPPSDHGLMGLEPHSTRSDLVYHSYPSSTNASMDSSHLYASPSLWHSPQHVLDEKRGSVIMGQPPTQPPPKRKGGRKPKDDPNLPPAERHKRMLRRLRNKEAAAKCRERRLNHTTNLLKQIEDMERQQKAYEEQINNLRVNKQKCEKLLETHRHDCDKSFIIPSTTAPSTANSATSSPASSVLLPPTTASGSSIDSRSATTTPNSICTNNSNSGYTPISYQQNVTSSSRRKQTTPKLSLDTSCAASHRLSSSSSNSDLHSPLIMP